MTEVITVLKEEEKFLKALDVSYSYNLAKKMEKPGTNPVLGFRTAGSGAEFEVGEMLAREMRDIGLSDVVKDRVEVDAWDFHHAVLSFRDRQGRERSFQLGAYQTQFDTQGPKTYSLVYAGKGTARDYEGLDVRDKLVLVDINQRDEWWINFPVYQAKLKGAAALIAVQDQGYGEVDDEALNAQDIAGPADAPAFSISRADARVLKEEMERGEILVSFDAKSLVREKSGTYNIVGRIPGRNTKKSILLSAHYDSYFSGFQDDNTAVSMMLGIARALVKSGFQPKYNLIFCAMAAEEWGVINSKYDWSTGAYEEIFTVRPQWRGQVIADLNFELPAFAHGKKDGVRCTYEYESFLKEFVSGVSPDKTVYPEGIEVLCPIETWSDDFSMAIGGIPSMVNDFASGEFMETHYHSQFDNEEFYDEEVYRFHHEFYGRLVLALDRLAVVPLDFSRLFSAVKESEDQGLWKRANADGRKLLEEASRGEALGKGIYDQISRINLRYRKMLEEGRQEEAERLFAACEPLQEKLLYAFYKEQDYFVRLNWHDEVLFPQQAVRRNLEAIYQALDCLEAGNIRQCLEYVYSIDNNRYAFEFDREVFDYFTGYVLDQPADRLKWGTGRIIHHENLFRLVEKLKKRAENEGQEVQNLEEQLKELTAVAESQAACYRDDLRYMTEASKKIGLLLEECREMARSEEIQTYGE